MPKSEWNRRFPGCKPCTASGHCKPHGGREADFPGQTGVRSFLRPAPRVVLPAVQHQRPTLFSPHIRDPPRSHKRASSIRFPREADTPRRFFGFTVYKAGGRAGAGVVGNQAERTTRHRRVACKQAVGYGLPRARRGRLGANSALGEGERRRTPGAMADGQKPPGYRKLIRWSRFPQPPRPRGPGYFYPGTPQNLKRSISLPGKPSRSSRPWPPS